MKANGLNPANYPPYMLNEPRLLLEVLTDEDDTYDTDDIVEAFGLAWDCEYGSSRDGDFDIVEDFGGAEKAIAFIESCRGDAVSVPRTQSRMIKLLHDAGFEETVSAFDGPSSQRFGNNASGVTGISVSNSNSGNSSKNESDDLDEGSDESSVDRDGSDDDVSDNSGPTSSRMATFIDKARREFTFKVCNERTDCFDLKSKSFEMRLDGTTLRHVKDEVQRKWNVPLDEQFYWAGIGEEQVRDDSRLIGDILAGKVIILREQTRVGRLKVEGSEMSTWWPLRFFYNWLYDRPLNFGSAQVVAEDLFRTDDVTDNNFSPYLSISRLALECDAEDLFQRDKNDVLCGLSIDTFFGVDEYSQNRVVMSSSSRRRKLTKQRQGYFVVGLSFKFEKQEKPLRFSRVVESACSPVQMALETSDIRNSGLRANVGVGVQNSSIGVSHSRDGTRGRSN